MSKISFHDFEIKSINADDVKSEVILRFKNNIEMKFFDITSFRATNFGMQNIVSRVLDSSVSKLPSGAVSYWVNWVTSLSDDSGSWLEPSRKLSIMESLVSGDMRLIVLEPSVGVEIACLCREMKVSC